MRKINYFVALLFCCIQLKAQKNINLIISIDDGIAVSSVSGLKLIAITTDGSKETIFADYYPGNLALNDNDYEKLLDTGIKAIHLVFNYTEYQKQIQQLYSYDID
jgi:hypothetical protein